MEILQIVWIFYVIIMTFMFVHTSYEVIKQNQKDSYNAPIMVIIIVVLSIFWPVILLAYLYIKGQKDREEGDKDGDY